MEEKNNSGVLFANEKQNDRQPDLKGHALINGTEMWVSAWKRTSQNGKEYISLSFEEKDAQRRPRTAEIYPTRPAAPAAPAADEGGDDLPF